MIGAFVLSQSRPWKTVCIQLVNTQFWRITFPLRGDSFLSRPMEYFLICVGYFKSKNKCKESRKGQVSSIDSVTVQVAHDRVEFLVSTKDWCMLIHSTHSTVSLLYLLRIDMHQSLRVHSAGFLGKNTVWLLYSLEYSPFLWITLPTLQHYPCLSVCLSQEIH